jgi:ketosteroid isomerase-like protein
MSEQTRAAILRFHDALNVHDADAVSRCITDDCVFGQRPDVGDCRDDGSMRATTVRRFHSVA